MNRATLRDLCVFAVFVGITVPYVHPLLNHLGTRIASDSGDPALNAAVLWWNATVVPFTEAWWNQPWFHPATGITTFTEHMTGLAPIATPAYWLTHNPVVAYNVTFFATWPLSAFAAYFLVRRVTGRTDAGVLAGLAFGFTPYRTAELGHLQCLSVFWLPVALGALHAYWDSRRPRWLFVFGAAWVMQSLASGYYMLFGAVLIALWLAYFGSSARTWRAAVIATGAWALACLPLVPVLLRYQRIHEYFGLRRTFAETLVFSAHPDSWFEVADVARWWRGVLPAGEDNLFPGVTAVLVVAVAVVAGLTRARFGTRPSRPRAMLQTALTVATVASLAALTVMLVKGPWSIQRGEWVLFRMTDSDRALMLLALCGIPLLWITPARDAIAGRHPFVFYLVATPLMALLACGPVLSVHDAVILDPSPYRWLMSIPGFDQLRVPSRFWMMGVLCLAAAAGIGYAAITRRRRPWQYAVFGAAALGLLADGWLTSMPTGQAPVVWTSASGSDPQLPLLELPLGPGWDAAATLRATAHGHRVLNGVSGYDPPHYAPMQAGLRDRDPAMLAAIASLGPYEVSIENANDRDGRWKRYVAAAPGASLAADDGERVVYRVPDAPRGEPAVGRAWPIQSVTSSRGDPSAVFDHRIDTDWVDTPQQSGQWLLADLGQQQLVGGVSLAIEEHSTEFPRRLAIEVSTNGARFEQVWADNAAALTFLAVLRAPRTGWLRVAFPSQDARFVRVRQTMAAPIGWRVPELEVNAPAGR